MFWGQNNEHNYIVDNIHRYTPCFYKPFNTKELLFYKKEETAKQCVYSMTVNFFQFVKTSFTRDTFSPITPQKRYLQYCTFLGLSYYILKWSAT